jgi:hypothetical protein
MELLMKIAYRYLISEILNLSLKSQDPMYIIGVSKSAQRILNSHPSKIIFPMTPKDSVSMKIMPTTRVVSTN